MGNDGGSIPKRRELVKEAARNPTASELKESRHEQQEWNWRTDPLNQRPLSRPIVSDALGRLFNKDSVIEFLLPSDGNSSTTRAEQEEMLRGTVRSLKDVVEVKFAVGQADPDESKQRSNGIVREERWICPITSKELGPGTKAVYLVPCGHAFSDAAVKEVSGGICLQCNAPYASNDIIPILSTSEIDIARLTLRMKILSEKGLAHSLKKGAGKKRKKNGVEAIASEQEARAVTDAKSQNGSKQPSRTSTPQPNSTTSTGIKNAATASLTAKVLEEQEERNKRRKMAKNENLDSLFATARPAGDNRGKNKDFMSRGYAIPAHQQR